MTGPPADAASVEFTAGYMYVCEIRSPGLWSTFIRRVRPDGPTPALTFEAQCTVDVDGDGRMIGVTVHQAPDDRPERRW